MFPDITVYTTSGDLSVLVAIFNGLAMICQNTTLIYGLASMVATYSVLVTVTRASVSGGSGLGAVAKSGFTSTATPFLIAILLTSGSLQSSVQIESTLTGAMSKVDHVPVVLSAIQGVSSELSHALGEGVETAFQGTGTDYASISDSGQGFINPLKTLLSARQAVLKLGPVDSEISALVAACINADSGSDFASIRNQVLHAGNSGAGQANSFKVSNATSLPTAIGALLYAAASNPSGKVLDIRPNDGQILSCNDAANVVANDISAALSSPEFARVAQGAVSSTDTPNPNACNSFDCLLQNYQATVSADKSSITAAIAGGASAANAELINLLFAEAVQNQLDCLRSEGANKAMCLADMMQRNAIEQGNLQEAANASQMTQNWGQYANMMLALITGLGPVVFILMMFSGQLSFQAVVRLAQFVLFPQIVMQVGSVLINGMMYMNIAQFLRDFRQSGIISQAMALEAYRRLGLSIGAASSLMASLPALLAGLFAYTAVAGFWRSPGSGPASNQGKDVAAAMSPDVMSSTPIMRTESMSTGAILPGGAATIKGTGALPMVSSNAHYGSMAREQSQALASVAQMQESISEGRTNLSTWQKAFRTGDYSRVGVDNTTGEAIHQNYMKQQAASHTQGAGVKNSDSASNTNKSELGVSGQIGYGLLGKGLDAGVKGSVRTGTDATDTRSNDKHSSDDRNFNESQQLSRAIDTFKNSTQSQSMGSESSHSLERSRSIQQSYQQSITESRSNSQESRDLVRNGASFEVASAAIKDETLALHAMQNRDYKMFQAIQGAALERNNEMAPYLDKAREEMASTAFYGTTGNERAENAVVRHRAAVLAYEQGSDSQKVSALKYLADEGNALTQQRFQAANPKYQAYNIAKPQDRTGTPVNGSGSTGGGHPPPVRAFPISAQPPASTPEAKALKQDVVTQVNLGRDGVSQQVKQAQATASEQGLGADRQGTMHRAGGNVVRNGKDVVDGAIEGVKGLFGGSKKK